ncbi:membrane protein [Chromobacterium sp. LK11]|nr:membrane protein [Chromobacterium sp. LK11]
MLFAFDGGGAVPQRSKLILEIIVNFLLPWLCYRYGEPRWGEAGALMFSALPPVLWSVVELVRFRRVDALSLLVLAGIGLSLLAMLLGGDARLLLLRESLITGLIGCGFLLSLALRRPLVFYLARATLARESAQGRERFEQLWRLDGFRRAIQRMTLWWGLGLSLEAGGRAYLAWTWPVERFLLVAPFISYGVMGGLCLMTLLYRRRMRREAAVGVAAP